MVGPCHRNLGFANSRGHTALRDTPRPLPASHTEPVPYARYSHMRTRACADPDVCRYPLHIPRCYLHITRWSADTKSAGIFMFRFYTGRCLRARGLCHALLQLTPQPNCRPYGGRCKRHIGEGFVGPSEFVLFLAPRLPLTCPLLAPHFPSLAPHSPPNAAQINLPSLPVSPEPRRANIAVADFYTCLLAAS